MQVVAEPQAISKRVAAFGLPRSDLDVPMTVDEKEWPNALSSWRSDHVTGLAMAAVEAGHVQLTDRQATELLEAHREAMLAPLAVERALVELAPAFESSNIDFIVLKGPAVAHTVYPDPSWRYFADLDLLVRAQDWSRTSILLGELGFERSVPDPRPGFLERFGGASSHRHSSGVDVDLHRTLVLGPFGLWMETERLFDHAVEFRVTDRTFRRLDDPSLLLHACIHASLGARPPLPVPVRDVAQIAHFAAVDWDVLAERASAWKLVCVVQHALRYAADSLGVDLPPASSAVLAEPCGSRERRALRAFVSDERQRGGMALSTLPAIRGLRAKLAYIYGLLFPDRAFLRARGMGSYRNRWRVLLSWFRGRRNARTRG